jgi:hypothetical protein
LGDKDRCIIENIFPRRAKERLNKSPSTDRRFMTQSASREEELFGGQRMGRTRDFTWSKWYKVADHD